MELGDEMLEPLAKPPPRRLGFFFFGHLVLVEKSGQLVLLQARLGSPREGPSA